MVPLLELYSWCLVTVSVLWLFFMVPWCHGLGLQCVSVVIPVITLTYFLCWVLFVVLSVLSRFATLLLRKRKVAALLLLFYCCCVAVRGLYFFLTVR